LVAALRRACAAGVSSPPPPPPPSWTVFSGPDERCLGASYGHLNISQATSTSNGSRISVRGPPHAQRAARPASRSQPAPNHRSKRASGRGSCSARSAGRSAKSGVRRARGPCDPRPQRRSWPRPACSAS
jgi:hypothetical protein